MIANAVSRLHSVNQWIGRAGRGPRSIQDVIGLAKPRQLARKAVEHRTIARQLGTDSDFDCDRIAGVESARRNHGCERVAFKAPSRSARAFGARQGFLVDTHCRWRPTPREAKFIRPFVWHTGVMTRGGRDAHRKHSAVGVYGCLNRGPRTFSVLVAGCVPRVFIKT